MPSLCWYNSTYGHSKLRLCGVPATNVTAAHTSPAQCERRSRATTPHFFIGRLPRRRRRRGKRPNQQKRFTPSVNSYLQTDNQFNDMLLAFLVHPHVINHVLNQM